MLVPNESSAGVVVGIPGSYATPWGRKRKSELVVEFMLVMMVLQQSLKNLVLERFFPFSACSCMLCGNTCYNYRVCFCNVTLRCYQATGYLGHH